MVIELVTHDKTFHADDIMSTALLEIVFGSTRLIRTRNRNVIDYHKNKPNSIIFDVGGGEYDHHNQSPNDEVKSSFGLLYDKYSSYLIKNLFPGIDPESGKRVELKFKSLIVEKIDMQDNSDSEDINPNRILTFPGFISSFNPIYREKDRSDLKFYQAVEIAKTYIGNVLARMVEQIEIGNMITKAVNNSGEDYPKYLILDDVIPWSSYLTKREDCKNVSLLIYPEIHTGTVRVHVVSDRNNKPKCKMPESWIGSNSKKLSEETDISGMMFCNEYLLGTQTMDSAIKSVNLILKYNSEE